MSVHTFICHLRPKKTNFNSAISRVDKLKKITLPLIASSLCFVCFNTYAKPVEMTVTGAPNYLNQLGGSSYIAKPSIKINVKYDTEGVIESSGDDQHASYILSPEASDISVLIDNVEFPIVDRFPALHQQNLTITVDRLHNNITITSNAMFTNLNQDTIGNFVGLTLTFNLDELNSTALPKDIDTYQSYNHSANISWNDLAFDRMTNSRISSVTEYAQNVCNQSTTYELENEYGADAKITLNRGNMLANLKRGLGTNDFYPSSGMELVYKGKTYRTDTPDYASNRPSVSYARDNINAEFYFNLVDTAGVDAGGLTLIKREYYGLYPEDDILKTLNDNLSFDVIELWIHSENNSERIPIKSLKLIEGGCKLDIDFKWAIAPPSYRHNSYKDNYVEYQPNAQTVPFTYKVTNTSDKNMRISGYVEMTSPNGQVIKRFRNIGGRLNPGQSYKVDNAKVRIPRSYEAGIYTLKLVVFANDRAFETTEIVLVKLKEGEDPRYIFN